MSRLSVFNSVSIDGYFTDHNGDIGWAHKSDPEFDAFTSENAGGDAVLLFGRVTYEPFKNGNVVSWYEPARGS